MSKERKILEKGYRMNKKDLKRLKVLIERSKTIDQELTVDEWDEFKKIVNSELPNSTYEHTGELVVLGLILMGFETIKELMELYIT